MAYLSSSMNLSCTSRSTIVRASGSPIPHRESFSRMSAIQCSDEEQRAAARWRASGGVSVLAMSYGFYSRNESIFLIQVFDDSDVLVSRCFQHAGTCFALCLVDFEVELASGG